MDSSTIRRLEELERRVQELESWREGIQGATAERNHKRATTPSLKLPEENLSACLSDVSAQSLQGPTAFSDGGSLISKLREELPKLLKLLEKEGNQELASVIINVLKQKGKLSSDIFDYLNPGNNEKEKMSRLVHIIGKNYELGNKTIYQAFIHIVAGLCPDMCILCTVGGAEIKLAAIEYSVGQYRDELKVTHDVGIPEDEMDAGAVPGNTYIRPKMVLGDWGLQPTNTAAEKKHAKRPIPEQSDDADEPEQFSKPERGCSLFFRGRSGIGKSTTMKKKYQDWTMNNWAEGYTFVFLLRMKMLSVIPESAKITIVELLTQYADYKIAKSDSQVSDQISTMSLWLKTHTKRVLIELDGLDEITDFSKQLRNARTLTKICEVGYPMQLCMSLLRRTLLPECALICSARPFIGLEKLKDYHVNPTLIDVVGFTRDGIKKYINNYYPESKVYDLIEGNIVLMSLCSVPFYCKEISAALNNSQVDTEHRTEKLKTYTKLSSMIVKRHTNTNLADEDTTFAVRASHLFPKLGKLAYNGIFHQNTGDDAIGTQTKLIFNQYDLKDADIDDKETMEMAKQGGLIQFVRKGETPQQQDDCICEFVHLSIQELFAAAYVLANCDGEEVTDRLERLSTMEGFDMVLPFMYGLEFDVQEIRNSTTEKSSHRTDKHVELKEFMKRMVNSEEGTKRSEIHQLLCCKAAFESQCDDIAKIAVDGKLVNDEGKLCFEGTPLSPMDCQAIEFTCRDCDRLTEISLQNASLDDTSVSIVAGFVGRMSFVSTLDLTNNSFSKDGLLKIGEMLETSIYLKHLILGCNHICDEWIKDFADCLETNNSLTSLSLPSNLIKDKGVEHIARAINNKSNWSLLNLYANSLTEGDGLNQLIETYKNLASATNIITLNVGKNDIDKCTGDDIKSQMNPEHHIRILF